MADKASRITIRDLRGGRNGIDAPDAPTFADNQCVEAQNVEWWQTAFARRRNGSSDAALIVIFNSGGPFTTSVASLFRYVPGTDESLAQLLAIDTAGTPIIAQFPAGGSGGTQLTLKDNLTGNAWDVTGCNANALFFLAYKSAQARMHVYDNATVRRAGLYSGGVAATVANTGAGAYAATLRYYRIRFTIQSGGVTTRRSEPTPVVSFTPSGAGTAARITRPTAPSEGETHWEVEASADNITFYCIAGDVPAGTAAQPAAIILATTTADDSLAPAVYNTYGVQAALGTYTLPPSAKFVCGADNRVLMFGSWTATDKQHRLWWSAVNGSLNLSDLERMDTTLSYFRDLDEHDSGSPTGVCGPVNGVYYAFKTRQIWEVTPTGDSSAAFSVRAISKVIGAIRHQSVSVGEDAFGRPCVYFLSHRGPYRYGVNGLEYVGHGIEDRTAGTSTYINLAATGVIAHAVYYSDRFQWWLWFASGSNNPNTLCVLDTRYGGWATYTNLSTALCSVIFNRSQGGSGNNLRPYIGGTGVSSSFIAECDTSAKADAVQFGNTFQAFVKPKPLSPGGDGFAGTVKDAILRGVASANPTITVTVSDYEGSESVTATGDLTPVAGEARVWKRLDGSSLGDKARVLYQLGDSGAVSVSWTLDALIVPMERGAPLS